MKKSSKKTGRKIPDKKRRSKYTCVVRLRNTGKVLLKSTITIEVSVKDKNQFKLANELVRHERNILSSLLKIDWNKRVN